MRNSSSPVDSAVGNGSVETTAGGSFINIMAHLLSRAGPAVLADQSLREEKSTATEHIVKRRNIMKIMSNTLVISGDYWT